MNYPNKVHFIKCTNKSILVQSKQKEFRDTLGTSDDENIYDNNMQTKHYLLVHAHEGRLEPTVQGN